MCIFFIALLLSLTFSTHANRSIFNPRQEQKNIVQDFIMRNFEKKTDKKYSISDVFSYHHSIKDSRIAHALFNTSILRIKGSLIEGRDDSDILADAFGLSRTFESTVIIKPIIRSIKYQLLSVFNFQNWFFRLYIPIVGTYYNINISECIKTENTEQLFPAGYVAISQTKPQESFVEALENPTTVGTITTLNFGKLKKNKKSIIRIPELRLEIGGELYESQNTYFSTYGICSFPTGKKLDNEFIFNPINGNNKHTEIGIGLSFGTTTYQTTQSKINFHALTNITHIIQRNETRSFDLLNNPLSRYLPIKIFNPNTKIASGNATSLINITTLTCSVRNNIQFDGLFGFSCEYNEHTGIIGYNGFFKGRDIVHIKEKIAENTYALKGIQNLFINTNPDSSTESTATIFGTLFTNQTNVADKTPIFIKNSDLDEDSAAMPFQLTHKFFVTYQYEKKIKKYNANMTFSIGTEIEIEGFNVDENIYPQKTTLNQWGIFLAGTFSF